MSSIKSNSLKSYYNFDYVRLPNQSNNNSTGSIDFWFGFVRLATQRKTYSLAYSRGYLVIQTTSFRKADINNVNNIETPTTKGEYSCATVKRIHPNYYRKLAFACLFTLKMSRFKGIHATQGRCFFFFVHKL